MLLSILHCQAMLRKNLESSSYAKHRELGRKKRLKKLAAKQAEEAASGRSTDPFGVSGYTLESSSSAAFVPTYTGGNKAFPADHTAWRNGQGPHEGSWRMASVFGGVCIVVGSH